MYSATVAAASSPSPSLGPWVDSAVGWTTWVTLMGFVGLTVLALAGVSAPAPRVTARLARVAAALGVLAVPAALTSVAQSASKDGGYDYAAAWNSLYDGSVAGLYSGLGITLSLVGAALVAPLAFRSAAGGRARNWLLGAGLAAGAVSLAVTKFPDDSGGDWGKTVIETVIWMMHLFGAAIWIGGLAGLLLLALPGAVPPADRGAFWAAAIRRFCVLAMSCVAAIALSGLFLYWEHVDGPEQLLTTLYGRTLGVKILIFGVLLMLGVVNQFFLHPRIGQRRHLVRGHRRDPRRRRRNDRRIPRLRPPGPAAGPGGGPGPDRGPRRPSGVRPSSARRSGRRRPGGGCR